MLKTPGIEDIEHVLEILDQVAELKSPLVRFLDHNYVYLDQLPWESFAQNSHSLRRLVRDDLFKTYEFDPSKRNSIQARYEDILEEICGNADYVHVFTTNYDSVFEEGLANSTRYAIRDGFLRSNSGPAVWTSGMFQVETGVETEKTQVLFYKLHGSLRWRTDKESGRMVRVDTEEKAAEDSRRFGENILLYPASKIAPTAEPFGTLFSLFASNLFTSPKCIVVGYSFRDPYLNTIFVDFLRRRAENAIYIISPNADQNMRNLLSDTTLARLEQSIGRWNIRFGETEVGAEIRKMISIG